MQEKTKTTLWKITARVTWSAVIVIFVLTFYVNWYMPHGPKIYTGEYECRNDGRGPCEETYHEDLRKVDIPEWAKFFRNDTNSSGLLIVLGILGVIASSRPPGGYKDEQ